MESGIGSAPGRFQGTERSVGRIKARVTTSRVFSILTVAFLINVTANIKDDKRKVIIKEDKKTGAGSAVVNDDYGTIRPFVVAVVTSNIPAWLILLLVMTFLADNPQTGQIAYALAWLILLGSALTNGEKAAKNVQKFVDAWNTKGLF